MTGDHHHHQHQHHDHHHRQQQHHHHGHHHHHHHHKGEDQPPPPVPEYGSFQPPFQPVMGYPQPPGAIGYARGYHQAIPGNYVVDERGVVIERPLRCCGLGVGWFLFILGFFLAGGPWYVASFILLCNSRSIDHREKQGYVACAIAVGIAVISLIVFLITGY